MTNERFLRLWKSFGCNKITLLCCYLPEIGEHISSEEIIELEDRETLLVTFTALFLDVELLSAILNLGL